MHRKLKRISIAFLLILLSVMAGTAGYMVIEDYSPTDAFYMSVITFSTVGFREVQPLSTAGRIFTSAYIIVNLTIFAYIVSALSSFLIGGDLQVLLDIIKTSREVKKYNNHVIVCGFGKNGTQACQELNSERMPFVVIEKDKTIISNYQSRHKYTFIAGDATLDETLTEAGVDRAAAVITTLPDDADNVFITLTAKGLNPSIKVIARASEVTTEKKLSRAGAAHVVMPDRLGGMHMANLITKPVVIEFLELLNGVGDEKLLLEEVDWEQLKKEFQDISMREMNIRDSTGVTVIAFKNQRRGFVFNPDSSTPVTDGNTLIILGNKFQIEKFSKKYTRA